MSVDSQMPITTDDDAAVREIPRRVSSAWEAQDAGAFAALFAEDSSLILPGDVYVNGRDGVKSFMDQAFAGPYKGTRVTGTPVAVRLVGDGVVTVITEGGVMAPGETEVAPERSIRASWLLVKDGPDWLISAYQNTSRAA